MVTATPRVALIAALAENRVIGRANRLPWHLPADLARFKRLTLDKPIIMGRRTWESLPGLLPRRQHIVVSRDPHYAAPGCRLASTPEAALALALALAGLDRKEARGQEGLDLDKDQGRVIPPLTDEYSGGGPLQEGIDRQLGAGERQAKAEGGGLSREEEVPEVMVIGGETLYRALLPRADRLYLTLVATAIPDGDAFFPAWEPAQWREEERLTRPRDEANPFDLTFLTLDRVRAAGA